VIAQAAWVLEPEAGMRRDQWRGSGSCTFVPITTALRSWSDTPVNDVFEAVRQINTAMATMFIVDRGRIGLLYPEYAAIITT
jgi:hypothetical protein